MSRGPNMSYCAFENTSHAIDQLIGMLSDAIDEHERLDINRYEQHYFRSMKMRAQRLVTMMEQYEDHLEDCCEEDTNDEEEDTDDEEAAADEE